MMMQDQAIPVDEDPDRHEASSDRIEPLRIGVSSCLLGEKVRFNGGHCRDSFLTDVFGPYVEWLPVCPEVEIGMGVPRPSVRLVRDGDEISMVDPKSGTDFTQAMRRYSARRAAGLGTEALRGYVLKKDSPSCGMERVKIYDANKVPARNGRGLFAQALKERFPNLPVEEEGRLKDPRLRENFIERIFAYDRLQTLFAHRWTTAQLVDFHTAHKLQLMAHHVTAMRDLGRMVAAAKEMDRTQLRTDYGRIFMHALQRIATVKRHTNVLQHICGYFKRELDDASKRELAAVIEDYRRGLIPLIVPITLIRHYVRRFEVQYLQQQHYLEPHPKELMLRNHV